MQRYLTLLPFLGAVLAVASTGALFRPGPWYDSLRKPSWTPPGWLFGPAWALLYVLIAFAGWIVWRADGFGLPLAVWIVQLLVNGSWSWVMFGLRRIGAAMAVLCLLWLAIITFMALAWPLSTDASLLFAPYLAWVTFAGALNFAVWRLNP
ncbi:MAG: TspO/MBR family protein [Hyphomicrobiaceae bacterium]